ncbi:MAG: amino acid adenylation domain-containing protein, partial [Legionellaceae bacterium]|nr:amino acid adenylation domain-containing protein [Legionellaceae bacterium]
VAFELPNELKSLSAEYNVTHYTTLLTGLAITLSRYTGQTDLTIGTPVANRQHPQLEHLIGFFVNTLVLRIQLDSNHTLSQCVSQIQSDLIEAQLHQDMPFEKLVDELKIERDTSRHPIFQVLYTVEYSDVDDNPEEDHISLNYDVAKFDLSIFLRITPNQIKGRVNYATSLFKPETIERFITHYQQILNAMLTCKEQAIGTYPILTQAEYQQIVIDWNKTEKDYPKDKTIHQLFEEQVKKTPNNIAVVFEEQQLTYKQLNEEANQLARYIHKQNPGEFVAICMDRSLEMIVAILGILKAGCAYVPIDPNYPKERIDYILADTKASLVLDNRLKDKPYAQESKKNQDIIVYPHDLAYVIYTSGTTGKPKGVMIEHQSLSAFIHFFSRSELYNLDKPLCTLALTHYIFDIFGLEYGMTLTQGGMLILSDLSRANADFNQHPINFIQQTPSLWARLLDILPANKLKDVICLMGGEALIESTASRLTRLCSTVFSVYGPTETTIWSSIFALHGSLPCNVIGRPLSNEKTYVLDSSFNPLPIGVIGELYIGGVGLARGYLNQPELTKERFIPNPFGAGRLYKTGDLVRWLADGNLEYIGRNDFQVKIRGYRIELGEIEHVLALHPDIKQSVVLAHDAKLIAYYVGQTKEPLEDYLRSKLPDYMIPSIFIAIESFPLTINGKLDRAALPLPDFSQNQEQYVAPRDEIESIACQIWQQALDVPQVGIEDDFFRLGGHSILAIQVTHQMSRALKRNILVADIFKQRTIATLCGVVKGHETLQHIVRVKDNPSPLSFAQERLWFIEQYEGGTDAYHIPLLLRREDGLIESLQRVIQRHAILRTRFVIDAQGQYLQEVHNEALAIEEDINPDEFLHRIFDLTKGHPLRAGLYEDKLLIVFHHIAFDAWSGSILRKELQSSDLPPLEIQYQDFAVWQRNLIDSKKEVLLRYWQNKLSDITSLQMPTDYPRPATIDYKGASVAFELPNELKSLSAEYNVTHYTTLLTGLAITLSRYTGQTDLTIGTPV